jgi:hypothetical protein
MILFLKENLTFPFCKLSSQLSIGSVHELYYKTGFTELGCSGVAAVGSGG